MTLHESTTGFAALLREGRRFRDRIAGSPLWGRARAFDNDSRPQNAPLVLNLANCYFCPMVRNRIRRLCAVVLALTLAVGVSTHGVHASDMGVKMAAAAASDMPMPGKCDCGGNDKMSVTSCSSQCAGIPAILTPSLALDIVLVGGYADVAAPSATGHTRPPDPYPPRPVVLS